MTCPHGMPARASCVECMHDGPVNQPERLTADRWIEAQWGGRCANDPNHRFEAGDVIGQVAWVGWVCTRCAG